MRKTTPRAALSLAALAVVFLLTLGCGGGQETEATSAEITAFEPPQGQVAPGDAAEALVRVRNTGPEAHTFFVGYSVREAGGEWRDAPAVPVEVEPGAESGETALTTPPLETPGYYASRVSVWGEEPQAGAERLAEQEKESSFRISEPPEEFAERGALPPGWKATDRKLGRGKIRSENVSMQNGKVRFTLSADTVSGAEIESEKLHGPGSLYTARIKVPDAYSSITCFLLYVTPYLQNEIIL